MENGEFLIIDYSMLISDVSDFERYENIGDEEIFLKNLWLIFGNKNKKLKKVTTCDELIKCLKWFSKYLQRSKPTYFLIALLGPQKLNHVGKQKALYSDMNITILRYVKEWFLNPKTCKVMIGKPKLFLFKQLASEGPLKNTCEWNIDYFDQRFKHFKRFITLLSVWTISNSSSGMIPKDYYAQHNKYSMNAIASKCDESSIQSKYKRKDRLVSK